MCPWTSCFFLSLSISRCGGTLEHDTLAKANCLSWNSLPCGAARRDRCAGLEGAQPFCVLRMEQGGQRRGGSGTLVSSGAAPEPTAPAPWAGSVRLWGVGPQLVPRVTTTWGSQVVRALPVCPSSSYSKPGLWTTSISHPWGCADSQAKPRPAESESAFSQGFLVTCLHTAVSEAPFPSTATLS